MSATGIAGVKYGNADGYDAYMGGWSALLAAPFLEFASVRNDGALVDIGCGTANLLAAAAQLYPRARLVGIDPSDALLTKARNRPELTRAILLKAGVERIPLSMGSADYTLSLLVLQEFSDRAAALTEMRRVTRAGGIVAACQWDFAKMPVIDALVGAINSVRPAAAQSIATSSPRAFVDESDLSASWYAAGLINVETGRIAVSRTFETFDELWRPLLAGSTPSTLTLAAMSAADQMAVRSAMEARLGHAHGALRLTAEALLAKGNA